MLIFSMSIYILLTLAALSMYYIKRRLSYWKRLGIPHNPPEFPQGSLKGFIGSRHPRELTKLNYEQFKDVAPFSGIYLFLNPAVVVSDLDLIRDILIKDFNNFADSGLFYNERDDPLTGHLLRLDGPKWKRLRTKLSPAFTSGKMKFMFPTALSAGGYLVETGDKLLRTTEILEIKDLLARYTVDVIGTTAFGINCNSLKDPNAEFHKMGAKVFTQNRHCKFVDSILNSFPDLSRKLRMRQIHEDVHQFFMTMVKDTVAYREENSIQRNDFMNMLIEMKNTKDGLTFEELAAQAYVFFVAGFETSSSTMGFALYELAANQDIQDKLRTEIDTQFEKSNGKFTYQCMIEMPYMDKVIKETLRKYSIAPGLIRKSNISYPTSNPKYVIPRKMTILIPIDAIHRDPEIYPKPEEFDPERFSHEEMKKRHPMTWLPFGDGPRNCIGFRFAKMQTYIGLALLLRNFRFRFCDRTTSPLEIDVANILLSVKGGIFLHVERV